MNKKLNIGVISCSVMAQLHMKAVIDHPNAELYMICDINEALLNETAAKYNISRKTTDYRQMLADPAVDAVIIVTPDQTHREISVAALEAGKHVLCEKPMALTLDDCKAMINAAAKAKTKMMVGQICRYTPGFVAAKNLIERGESCSLWKPNMHTIMRILMSNGVLIRCATASLAAAATQSIWLAGLQAIRKKFSPTQIIKCCPTTRQTTAPSRS